MDAGRKSRFGEKQRKDFGKGDAGVGHPNQNFPAGRERSVNNNGPGSALIGAREIVFVFGEREVARLSAVGGGKTGQDHSGVPDHLASEVFGYLISSEWHGRILALPPIQFEAGS